MSPLLQEDILLGMPALRKQAVTLHVSEAPGTDEDYLLLRRSGTKVYLVYHPHGLTSDALPLATKSTNVIPSGHAALISDTNSTKHTFPWIASRAITGLVEPANKKRVSSMLLVVRIGQNNSKVFRS